MLQSLFTSATPENTLFPTINPLLLCFLCKFIADAPPSSFPLDSSLWPLTEAIIRLRKALNLVRVYAVYLSKRMLYLRGKSSSFQPLTDPLSCIPPCQSPMRRPLWRCAYAYICRGKLAISTLFPQLPLQMMCTSVVAA